MQNDSRHHYENDPYRAAKKQPSPDHLPAYSSFQPHSRTPSENSTSQLARSNTPINEQDDYYSQDPYAPRQANDRKKTKKHHQPKQAEMSAELLPEKRANSYLPYSNHKRDPFNPAEPISLQEDELLNFNSLDQRGPVGSILHDNIVMEMMDDPNYTPYRHHNSKENNTSSVIIPILPPAKKKPWWTRLGISGKKLLFVIFSLIVVIVLVWYFCWPRVPTLYFLDASLTSDANYTTTSMQASWTLDFTVDNSQNWIPTNIKNFAISVYDDSTGETFGTGNSGQLTLWPRQQVDQEISMNVNINFTGDATSQTLKNLLNACWLINQDLSNPTPNQTLDVKFRIVYYITGIAWTYVSDIGPSSYFSCPSSS